jgi:hypothetical protein
MVPEKPKRNRLGVSCAPLAVALSVMPRKPRLAEIDESALECVRTRDMCSRTEMKTKIDDEIALDTLGPGIEGMGSDGKEMID